MTMIQKLESGFCPTCSGEIPAPVKVLVKQRPFGPDSDKVEVTRWVCSTCETDFLSGL